MKKYLISFLLAGCAVGPHFSGAPTVKPDPMNTVCAPFSYQPTSVDPQDAVKSEGKCIQDYVYKVVDSNKTFQCTATTKGAGDAVGFAFDVLTSDPITYQYRYAADSNGSQTPVNGIGPTGDNFFSGKTSGIQRVILNGKSPAPFMHLEAKFPVGTILGPFCWQMRTNVE